MTRMPPRASARASGTAVDGVDDDDRDDRREAEQARAQAGCGGHAGHRVSCRSADGCGATGAEDVGALVGPADGARAARRTARARCRRASSVRRRRRPRAANSAASTRTSRRPVSESTPDDVAVAHPGDRAGVHGLGRHVDGGRDGSGRAAHPAVGDQRDGCRGSAARRATGSARAARACRWPRALVADHDDDVAVELAPRERLEEADLVGEDPRRRLDHAVLGGHGRHLDHRVAEGAASTRRPPSAANGSVAGRSTAGSPVCRGAASPDQRARRRQHRPVRVAAQAGAGERSGRPRAAARRRAGCRRGTGVPPAAWKWFTSAGPLG